MLFKSKYQLFIGLLQSVNKMNEKFLAVCLQSSNKKGQ